VQLRLTMGGERSRRAATPLDGWQKDAVTDLK
jgi:hypothetical protein